MTTHLGPIEIKEQIFQRSSKTEGPLCDRLKIRPGGYSRVLEEALVDFGAEDSFELAAQRMGRHHPVQLCANTVRKITLEHAQRIKQIEEKSGVLGALPAKGCRAKHSRSRRDNAASSGCKESRKGDRRKTRTTRWAEMRLCAAREADTV